MSRPFPLIIKPVGRQQLRVNVNNETSLQEIISQLRDPNLQLYHNCEELINVDEKKLIEFPITVNSPFYFIPEVIDYNRTPSIQRLIFHNGNKQKEVRQDGRVITACLSSFFRGPWRLIYKGHLISLRDLPSVGDIYVEQKTENFIDVEIFGSNLMGNIIFEVPKTSTIADIYQRLSIRYGIDGQYLYHDGLSVDGSIANYIDDRGFLKLQLLTYNGVPVNHRGHGILRYGFLYRESSIYDLKKLIRLQKKIPIPWIDLYFNGCLCDNETNIFDIIRSENDILELVVTRGETFSLEINNKMYDVQWDFTIADIRQIAQIPNGKLYRTFLGVYPYDPSISVDAAFFKPEQIVDASTDSNFRVFVFDSYSREKSEFIVNPCESFCSLRVRISSIKKVDPNSFKIIYMGTQLNDNQSFAGCRIGKDATINLVMTRT